MLPPTATGSGESDFRTRRFAPALTVVEALLELLPGTASSGEVTVAVLVTIVPFGVAAATFTTKVIVLVPTGTDGLMQFGPDAASNTSLSDATPAGTTSIRPRASPRRTWCPPASRPRGRCSTRHRA